MTKLAYLTILYPAYLEDMFRRNPQLLVAPYDVQVAAMKSDGFGWNGAWGPAMSPLGYEVQEFYSNAEPIQRRWSEENGGRWDLRWRTQIVWEQIRRFSPDVLFTDDPRSFDATWIRELRSACPSLRLVIGFIGGVTYDFETIRAWDAVLSCASWYVDYFRGHGARGHLLRHAFNASVDPLLPSRGNPENVVAFIGNVVRGSGYHMNRELVLERLVENVPAHLHSPQSNSTALSDFLETTARRSIYGLMKGLQWAGMSEQARRRIPLIGRAATWDSMPQAQLNPRLRPHMRPAVFGLPMYGLLRRTAVAFNSHIDVAREEAGNCRLFEATGVGSCVLTDWKSNLKELFREDEEVIVYRSPDEAAEKARWLIDHENEREKIAEAGRRRTFAEHLFHHRAAELDSAIRELLAGAA